MEAEIAVPYFKRGISIVAKCVKRTKKNTSDSNRLHWGRNKLFFALLWMLDNYSLLTFEEGKHLQFCINIWLMCSRNAVVCKSGWRRFSWSKHRRKFDPLEYNFVIFRGYYEDLLSDKRITIISTYKNVNGHMRNAKCIRLTPGFGVSGNNVHHQN